MCVCIYVCMCECMYVCMYVCIFVCMFCGYVCLHVCMRKTSASGSAYRLLVSLQHAQEVRQPQANRLVDDDVNVEEVVGRHGATPTRRCTPTPRPSTRSEEGWHPDTPTDNAALLERGTREVSIQAPLPTTNLTRQLSPPTATTMTRNDSTIIDSLHV